MWLHDKVVEFFGTEGIVALESTHQLGVKTLTTLPGIEAIISPIFPALLVLEMVLLFWVHRRSIAQISAAYKIPVLIYLINILIAVLIHLEIFLWSQKFFSKHAPFTATVSLLGFLYTYIVWELSHFVYHYTCHKVRLLWILHAPHHAPRHMNLSVTFTAFFLQGAYATFVRTAICSILGVPMSLLILAIVIDGCWGALIHMSEEVWSTGAIGGILGQVFLSPLHHRIHHSSNAEYIDKNFCNTLSLWDRIFGTFQQEIPEIKPQYGLTRKVKENGLLDAYFGEIYLLAKDVKNARSIKIALLHIIMPPSWKPK